MKKIVMWVINVCVAIYTILITIGMVEQSKEIEKYKDKLLKEQNRGCKIREKIRERITRGELKTCESCQEISRDIIKKMQSDDIGEDEFRDLEDEAWTINVINHLTLHQKYSWLDTKEN